MLGTQLISGLRDILLSELFKIDARDWMVGSTIDLTKQVTVDENDQPCCWIDFLSDTGDSARLVYQLAYLLQQQDLAVRNPLAADGERDTGMLPIRLPRGAALIVGGDTAYPIATREQLVQRIRAPFLWARHELETEAEAARQGNRAPERTPAPTEPPIKLLAIPGNHDYYNSLDGYQRHFRPRTRSLSGPRLDLPGYEPEQTASYFAVDLPYDWQLFALDVEKPKLATESSKLDPRQRDYFAEQIARRPCKNRIVVTSKPAVVYQDVSEAGEELAAILRHELKLPAPYLDDMRSPRRPGAVTLEPDELRLDLSGDVHIYERYWGTTVSDVDRIRGAPVVAKPASPPTPSPAPTSARQMPPSETWDGSKLRGNETTRRTTPEDRPNYASVVTGLGGAFHHPGQVRFGTITPQCAWPSAAVSAKAIAERLIRPRKVFQAGAVGVIGIAVAVLCFWLAWSSTAGNLLDVPYALLNRAAGQPFAQLIAAEQITAVDRVKHLAAIASFIGVIAAMIGAVYGCARFAQWLGRPIGDHRPAKRWWGWSHLTYVATHHWFAFWLLRWIGGNRRSSWRFLITAPAWAPLIAFEVIAIWTLAQCTYFATAGDDYLALYIVVTVILVAMAAVAVFVGGDGHGWARVPLALFAILIGALVVWTPYAWMRSVSQCNWVALAAVGLFLLYQPFRWLLLGGNLIANARVRRGAVIACLVALAIYCTAVPWSQLNGWALGALGLFLVYLLSHGGNLFANAKARRVAVIVCFAALASYYAMVPIWLPREPLTHPVIGCGLAIFFGAYFSCLWIGWYFFVSLQFNMHGNEAGSAARVVQYAEFLRIKLRNDAAEVYVIAAEGPESIRKPWEFWKIDRADHPIHARLVDHFIVESDHHARRRDQA